ncbi:MAG: GNAT family N-acetyltransferase, partial [Traorella sp.]
MLETTRLIIRKCSKEDVLNVLEFRNSEFVLKYNAMEKTNQENCIKEIMNDYALYEKENQKVIGIIEFFNDEIRYRIKSICISYYLNEKYAHQGYMYEALQAVIQDLFEQDYEVISARVFVPNIASTQLLYKLGFTREGIISHAVKGYQDIIYDDQLFT